ncbi:MAG: acyltransferase [Treponema sp.]|nr:acyltransferase [Treponema sp.]
MSYIVYALFILLFIWGGKFAGFRSTQFHEDSSSLSVSKSLRGMAALGVMLHHISQEQTFQQAGGNGRPGVISLFVNIGYLFVALFFFWSGFGLIKSLNAKRDYLKGFMKKRVIKILVIPFYVSVLIYAAFHLIIRTKMPVAQWIANFTGLTLMNDYAWYPIVAGILYTVFYLLFKNVKSRKVCFAAIALIILFQGLFFCVSGHFAWWAGDNNWWLSGSGWAKSKWWMAFKIFWFSGEWWVNSTPAFFIGLLFASFEDGIVSWLKKNYWPKLFILVVLTVLLSKLSMFGQEHFGYWTEFSGKGPGIVNKLMTYIMQVPQSMIFVILIYAVMLKYHASNPVTSFLGNISLETYMMNLIAITSFRFLIYNKVPGGTMIPVYRTANWNLALYVVAVIVSSVILALIYRQLNSLVQKKVFRL